MNKFTVFFVLSWYVAIGFSLPYYWGYSSPFYHSFYSQGWNFRPYLSNPTVQWKYGWRYSPYGYYPLTYVMPNVTVALNDEKCMNNW